MIRSHDEHLRKSKEKKNKTVTRENGGACFGGRKNRSEQAMLERRDCAGATLKVEGEATKRWHCSTKTNENWSQTKSRSRVCCTSKRNRAIEGSVARDQYRVAIDTKKKQLGLNGNLRNRHLSKDLRQTLVEIIKWAISEDEGLGIIQVCQILEISPRA
jgi:hypothetical protein